MPPLHWKLDAEVWYLLVQIGDIEAAIATVFQDGEAHLTGFKDGNPLPCNDYPIDCSLSDVHLKIGALTGWTVPEIPQ